MVGCQTAGNKAAEASGCHPVDRGGEDEKEKEEEEEAASKGFKPPVLTKSRRAVGARHIYSGTGNQMSP